MIRKRLLKGGGGSVPNSREECRSHLLGIVYFLKCNSNLFHLALSLCGQDRIFCLCMGRSDVIGVLLGEIFFVLHAGVGEEDFCGRDEVVVKSGLRRCCCGSEPCCPLAAFESCCSL